MKKKTNEELQSRREFFKNAAKATLPILGALLVSSNSLIAKAINDDAGYCSHCNSNCTNGCRTGCHRGCGNNCYVNCEGYTHKYHPSGECATCKYNCAGCQGQCSGTCSGTCSRTSYTVA